MRQSGLLEDLSGDALVHWQSDIADITSKVIASAREFYRGKGYEPVDHVTSDGDADLLDNVVPIEWNAYPVRYDRAVGAKRAERFFAARDAGGDVGRFGHEEYIEWREVRGVSNRLVRIELTTETREYWSALAAHDPVRTMERIAEFAREPAVDWRLVYGPRAQDNPFAPGRKSDERLESFQRYMHADDNGRIASPYNNGLRGICFMALSFNQLGAALNLAAYGAQPIGPAGENRPFTGGEAISSTGTRAAVDCRNSDPTIYGAAIRAAWDGRKIAFADPVGVYIKDIRRDGLLMPDGETPIPPEWWRSLRGSVLNVGGETFSLSQRLVLETPAGLGFTLGDLIVADTGQALDSGADIARMVTIAFYLKLSASNKVVAAKAGFDLRSPADCSDQNSPDIKTIRDTVEDWEASLSVAPAPQPLSRG